MKSLLCSLKIYLPTGLSESDSGRGVTEPSILGGQLYSRSPSIRSVTEQDTHTFDVSIILNR